ncbi:MAG: hypothetical protein QG656_1799, partial [Candidatus Hydrogenedentes bacterium]|nr:hypothetical protein [Candidatus Hydrogenedentota bacterium]
ALDFPDWIPAFAGMTEGDNHKIHENR